MFKLVILPLLAGIGIFWFILLIIYFKKKREGINILKLEADEFISDSGHFNFIGDYDKHKFPLSLTAYKESRKISKAKKRMISEKIIEEILTEDEQLIQEKLHYYLKAYASYNQALLPYLSSNDEENLKENMLKGDIFIKENEDKVITILSKKIKLLEEIKELPILYELKIQKNDSYFYKKLQLYALESEKEIADTHDFINKDWDFVLASLSRLYYI